MFLLFLRLCNSDFIYCSYVLNALFLFLAGSWFNRQCSCYSFHFTGFLFLNTLLMFLILFQTCTQNSCYCIVPFLWTHNNVPSPFFDLVVPKNLNCICLADLMTLFLFSSTIFLPIYNVIYQVVWVLLCFIMLQIMYIVQAVSMFLLRIQYLCKLYNRIVVTRLGMVCTVRIY